MASASCPVLLISAPASGQGKTTLTAGLARFHARQGRRVRVFKCGPDFLDPFWLELASAAPVHNLDLWINGEQDCRARLHAAAQEADLILIEGVMGLYDGSPSAADLALKFGLPVLAIADAAGMAGTFGALALGLQNYRGGLRWAGIMANRAGSPGHARMLMDALNSDCPGWGALPADHRWSLPERHLGLVAAYELSDARERLDVLADAIANTDLGRLPWPDWSRWKVEFAPFDADSLPAASLRGVRIALGRDAAFSFVYPANVECLQAMGAEVIEFSPGSAPSLPECDAVWLPGGYPELHAERLSAHLAMRDALTAHAQEGRPIWAECGGMMPLFQELIDVEGRSHPMWGLLPGRIRMQRRLAGLGSRQWELQPQALRGHEFHYSVCETPLPAADHVRRQDGSAGAAIYAHGSVLASYFHAWFPSSPAAVSRIFRGDR